MAEQDVLSGSELRDYVETTLEEANRVIKDTEHRYRLMKELLESIEIDPDIGKFLFERSRLSRETKSQAEQELANRVLLQKRRQQAAVSPPNPESGEDDSGQRRSRPLMMRGLNI